MISRLAQVSSDKSFKQHPQNKQTKEDKFIIELNKKIDRTNKEGKTHETKKTQRIDNT